MSPVHATITCVCYGKQGVPYGRRLIRACWKRHRRHGTLTNFPQDRAAQQRARREAGVKGGAFRTQLHESLIEDYAFLREQGESKEMAALRVGIAPDTARKYERRLRVQAGEAPPPDPDREPRTVRLVRVRALVVEHIHRWPGVLFSVASLARSLAPKVGRPFRTTWDDVRAVTADLVSEGVLEVVPGGGSYSPGGAVQMRRFRLASPELAPVGREAVARG